MVPEEDDDEENTFSTEFLEDQEAAYLKDPKKALQGFYDREGGLAGFFNTIDGFYHLCNLLFFQLNLSGEELEFEYEDKGRGSWLCRIK